MPSDPQLLIGWTTLGSVPEAETLAGLLLTEERAVCVQQDAPVRSWYRWEGKTCVDEEIRLWIKGTPQQFDHLPEFLSRHHPYDTPQWIVVGPVFVAEKYLQWAHRND